MSEDQKYAVISGWLVVKTEGCTCCGGPPWGHEAHCGYEPVASLEAIEERFQRPDLGEITDRVWRNKMAKGFNTTDVAMEFCLLTEEVGEAMGAWRKTPETLGAELADIAIFLVSLAKMNGLDLQAEIEKKMAQNEARNYQVLENGTHVKAPCCGGSCLVDHPGVPCPDPECPMGF